MSHELRTPLNAIIGYSEILQEEAHDQGLEEFDTDLTKIRTAGKHLLDIIGDILNLSQIETGKVSLYLEMFDVMAMIDEVVITIQPAVRKNGNVLTINYAPNSPQAIYADQVKVRQVLMSLLSNATKFTHEGSITLEVSNPSPGWISFCVADTGIGITQEQKEHLFQAFMQADPSSTRRYGGTGLGLAISQNFCQMMGGIINVESEYGKGSRFQVCLPTMVIEQPGQRLGVTEQAGLVTNGAHGSGGSAGTLLIIDDDPLSRELLTRMVLKEGFRVETAVDGEQGLKLAKALHPDVIILDVMMPKMSGWAVLIGLKDEPELENIPVVMVTILDDKRKGFALGATDYLTKPIDQHHLVRVISKYRRDHAMMTDGAILVVEDDTATREILQRTLQKEGWVVASAENGRIALEQVAEHQPDLILLDLMMPEMDGFQVLNVLRSTPAWKTIPVLVVTAKELTPEEHQRLGGVADRTIQKGAYSRDELLHEVRRLVLAHGREGDEAGVC
jgi:CheY-like chemotaxis protein